MAAKVGFEPTTNRLTADRSTAELLGNFLKMVLGVGIEPTLGPHLGHTDYKSVGASNYTNPV